MPSKSSPIDPLEPCRSVGLRVDPLGPCRPTKWPPGTMYVVGPPLDHLGTCMPASWLSCRSWALCAQSFMRPVGLCVRIYPGDLEGLPPVHLASAAGHHGDGWSANPPQEHLRGVIIIVVIVAITISIHLLKTQRKYVFILLSLLPVEGVADAIFWTSSDLYHHYLQNSGYAPAPKSWQKCSL